MNRFVKLIFVLAIFVLPVCANDYSYNQDYEYSYDRGSEYSESKSEKEDTVKGVSAEQDKMEKIYRELEVPTFSYQHNVDPDQYYDMQNTTWSPYPLLRLNSPLYFKTVTIEPGYYLLTPRKNEDKWYILFKEAGKVKHIIPVYERDYTPETFYEDNLPEPELNAKQKTRNAIIGFAGLFKSSMRPKEKKSFLEVNDLQNDYLQLILYWGDFKYHTIFRSVPM